MNILLLEDEVTIGDRIEKFARRILGTQLRQFNRIEVLSEAMDFLEKNSIELLLLDLNLNGEDGFKVLHEMTSRSFQTIVISANTDRALEAFHYEVLDFIAKPFTEKRLRESFARLEKSVSSGKDLRFLSVAFHGTIQLIPIEDLTYIQADHNCSVVHVRGGRSYIHQKSLQSLLKVLPIHFLRIHRSYIVNEHSIHKVIKHGAGKYEIWLHTPSITLPLSRARYHALKHRWKSS